jgi:hypothetical protein
MLLWVIRNLSSLEVRLDRRPTSVTAEFGGYFVCRGSPTENTGLQRNTLEEFSSILDTVGALANQRQKLRANFFLIVEYALDGETGGAATEPQILQRNESRDIHMPRGALNTKVPKTKIPAHSRKGRAIRTGYLVS